MANYLCRTITEVPGYMLANIRVPAAQTAGLYAGEVVLAETLDTTLYGNNNVYAPAQITDITTQEWAIVLNGSFEEMSDGRRPDGNPDYTSYIYNPGEVATTVRAMPNVRFEISEDSCNATVAAATIVPGDNLIPANGSYQLTYSAAATQVTAKHYLTIEATKFFRIGGQNGAQFAQSLVCRAKSL